MLLMRSEKSNETPNFRSVEPKIVEDATEKESLDRREFCGALALASTVFLAGAGDSSGINQQPALRYPPARIEGAERLMPGTALHFSYPTTRDPAILVRTVEAEYYAYSQRCTHRSCSVEYNRVRGQLQCPCHNGSYDARTGFVMAGPPPRPLDQIIIEMRAGVEVWAVGKRVGNADHNA